jgi:hypothetical protein
MGFVSTRKICIFLSFVLHFFASDLVQAQIIRYQAANTTLLRDLKNGLHFATFLKHEFQRLNVTPRMSLHVQNKKKCQLSCVQDLHCLSLNVGVVPRQSDGQLQCELLATDMFKNSMNMTDHPTFHHFRIKVFKF